MTDAVESRASIINDYVSSAEEYMTAFASVKGIFEGLYVGKELMRVESAIRHLGNLDLSAGQELDTFHGRKDEIGMIAQTTRSLCGRLQKTIDDIVRILGEMAEGNIAVDVSMNESYYIGDFRILSDNPLQTHEPDARYFPCCKPGGYRCLSAILRCADPFPGNHGTIRIRHRTCNPCDRPYLTDQ